MSGTRCRWFVVSLAMLAVMGSVVSSSSQILSEMLEGMAKARANMDPVKLEQASDLGELVGRGRMRNMVLRLRAYSVPELRHLKSYNEEVWNQKLRMTTDVDAVTEMLRRLAKVTDDQLVSKSPAERGQLIRQHLEPACRVFYDALRPVFERDLDGEQERQLADAIHDNGLGDEVRQMIQTWADFGTCKTLIGVDLSLLIDRIPKRIDDNKRIAAKRLTRAAQN